jgi:hypothetical protein
MILTTIDRAACLRRPQCDAVVGEQRCHRGVLASVGRPFVFPITTASHPRSGSARAAACGRHAYAGTRLCSQSKNSATVVPCRATNAAACSRCRAREVTGSCQSSVDTRP